MRRQEQADFEGIYKEYYCRLFAFLYKLTGDWHTAEELTQESFYQAFRSLGSFRGECELFTWLAGIGRHVFYRWLRRKRLQPEAISPEAAADAVADVGLAQLFADGDAHPIGIGPVFPCVQHQKSIAEAVGVIQPFENVIEFQRTGKFHKIIPLKSQNQTPSQKQIIRHSARNFFTDQG